MVSQYILRIQKRSQRNLMKNLLLSLCLLTTSAWANLHLAPPDFEVKEFRAVFVDFTKADYDITYDVVNKTIKVKSKIVFKSTKLGSPVFDLVPTPSNVILDGHKVQAQLTKAPDGSSIRVVGAVVDPGTHVLEVENSFSENVHWTTLGKSVSSAFWIRDLKDRMFMEQYIPSNYEFDQYPMSMKVTFKGLTHARQDIYTNGKIKQLTPNSYQIDFPAHFTVSCPYFHVTPKGRMRRFDLDYTSINGRKFPMTIYSPWYLKTSDFKNEALKVMAELEKDYGAWSHPSLIAYGMIPGTGGMEHAGATATSLAALDHEMLHSYFAKGVMPASGNSGWIDEAIASWRDWGYPRTPTVAHASSGLGNHSAYQRNTDVRAYSLGKDFMAYLDYRLQDKGGLKAFLRGYYHAYKHTVITNEHFKNNLEFFSGLDLTDDFNTYVWGADVPKEEGEKQLTNSKHVPLTKKQLQSIL